MRIGLQTAAIGDQHHVGSLLNGNYLYPSSRTQKIISSSSSESELQSIVSSMCDCLFIRRCLEFILGAKLLQVHFTDSSSARQLVSRQGVGKVRHLAGKMLWVQTKVREGEVMLSQIPTSFNISDESVTWGPNPFQRNVWFH